MISTRIFDRARTKIVCTLGPATDTPQAVAGLIEAGADVFRINTAHGDAAAHQRRLNDVRAASEMTGQPTGVLADLAGPKIRLGELAGGEFRCEEGAIVRFVRGDAPQPPGVFTVTYRHLLDELSPGDRIMLADGTVGLVVEKVSADAADCRVTQAGTVRNRQGVNLPGVKLSTPALTPQDEENVRWAEKAGVDYLGLSFVRTAEDVQSLRAQLGWQQSALQIIAKIEKPEALENLDAIIAAADGLMVARGDLGVEIDVARIAVVQKDIVQRCNRAGKPVIVATQMLDSMQKSQHPTRAEATDVANAVLDGADACMLSGETAVGAFPRRAVEMMHRIALTTEIAFREVEPQPLATAHGGQSACAVDPVTFAVVRAASGLARHLQAKTIIVASHTGWTALALSSCRNFAPTIGASDDPATLRRMCLYWGVTPLAGAPVSSSEDLVRFVEQLGRDNGSLSPGDRLVVVRGSLPADIVQNTVVVHEVR